MQFDMYGSMLPRAKKGPFQFASNHWVKQIIHNQLDCSYKTPFEIGVYRDAQCYAIKWGLKWVRLKKHDWDTSHAASLYSICCNNFSFCVPKEVVTRIERWLNWMKRNNKNGNR